MQRALLAWTFLAVCGCASSPPPPTSTPAPGAEPTLAAPDSEPAATAGEPAPEPSASPETSAAPPPPTEAAPAPEPAPEPATPAPPAELEGTLLSRTGKRVEVRLGGESLPDVGAKASLLRHFSGKSGDKTPLGALGGLFGSNVSIGGWLAVADVVVKKVENDVVTLEIEQERSKMVLNGKPVNHFSAGAKIRLASRRE